MLCSDHSVLRAFFACSPPGQSVKQRPCPGVDKLRNRWTGSALLMDDEEDLENANTTFFGADASKAETSRDRVGNCINYRRA